MPEWFAYLAGVAVFLIIIDTVIKSLRSKGGGDDDE